MEEHVAHVERLFEEGDNSSRQQNWQDASKQYGKSFNYYAIHIGIDSELRKQYGPESPMWLLYNKMHADFQLGDYLEVMQAAAVVHQQFGKLKGFVIGNPYFHLRVGQAKYRLCPNEDQRNMPGPGSPRDELARALIGGGPRLFANEPAEYYQFVQSFLRPPQDCATWDDASDYGCLIEALNSSRGYLRELFTERFGSCPPWSNSS